MLARVVAVAASAAAVLAVSAAPASADGAAVTAVNPGSAPWGATIDVQYTGLGSVTQVTFAGGASAAPAAAPSANDVQVVVPQGAQDGPVSVTDGTTQATSSAPFDVVESASLSPSASSVVYPATVALTATLTSGGAPVAGHPATLQLRPAGASAWTNGPQATTASDGTVKFTVRPLAITAYQVAFDAASPVGPTTSNAVTVTQHPAVSIALPSAAPILTTVRVTGVVRPAQTGTVVLERRYSGAWHKVAAGKLDSRSRYSIPIKLPSKTTFTYRVRRPADTHQAGNTSVVAKVLGINRTLRSGLSGPDVTALQNRLKALHYDVGRITGTFNFDTAHAVVAFQKIQGIARDGIVGPKAWAKLASPRIPRLRHPLRGVAAIEVDLTRQVVYYAVDGTISRIFDSSTGGGYWYTGSDGTQQRAITPTGHFSVKYKVNGWVKSKLGVLYRPAYFNYDGYAIHGEPEVPSYPASHGCVRITVPAMDRLYSKLSQGLSVWIYRS